MQSLTTKQPDLGTLCQPIEPESPALPLYPEDARKSPSPLFFIRHYSSEDVDTVLEWFSQYTGSTVTLSAEEKAPFHQMRCRMLQRTDAQPFMVVFGGQAVLQIDVFSSYSPEGSDYISSLPGHYYLHITAPAKIPATDLQIFLGFANLYFHSFNEVKTLFVAIELDLERMNTLVQSVGFVPFVTHKYQKMPSTVYYLNKPGVTFPELL